MGYSPRRPLPRRVQRRRKVRLTLGLQVLAGILIVMNVLHRQILFHFLQDSDTDNKLASLLRDDFLVKAFPVTTNVPSLDFLDEQEFYRRRIAGLETQVSYRYYMYEDDKIVNSDLLPNITGDMATEVQILQALQRHPLRTRNAEEADLFIIPMPTEVLCQKARPRIRKAINALLQKETFQKHQGNRHVLVALEGRFFDASAKGKAPQILNSYSDALMNVTIARNHDVLASVRLHKDHKDHGDWNGLFDSIQPTVRRYFSVGILAGPGAPYHPASYESFLEAPITLFFHTRRDKMARGSSKYRNALLGSDGTDDDGRHGYYSLLPGGGTRSRRQTWPFVTSLGYDIAPESFWKEFSESKFCLVMRGDTPNSHALLRAVSVGCIPIIICDYYRVYSPTFQHSLDLQEFAIFLEESVFLKDPRGSLLDLIRNTTMHPGMMQRKLLALDFAQRVALPDHPKSLFVPAFLKEAYLASRS